VTGHVSARIPGTSDMLVRCRPAHDPGVAATMPEHIRRTSLERASDELTGYWLPGEFSLHAEILRHRPEMNAVVHGHPRSSLLCGIGGLELRPVFGAYDPVASGLVVRGLPTFPRSVLISTPELGRQVVETMGDQQVCLLVGHGIVTCGRTVEEATVLAIKLETVAEVAIQLAMAGLKAPDIPTADMDGMLQGNVVHEQRMGVMQWTYDLYARALQGGLDPS
jgi:ribulose-5-phosphate 4-epimerase/fuculose-1-phosphate aldolase